MTGGVASGKSLVMELLKEKGAVCFSADQASRVVAGRNTCVLEMLKSCFGDSILLQDGSLNRANLAAAIFSSTESKETVDRIMHPPILRLLRAQMEGAQDDLSFGTLIAVEVPLLFETGMQSWFDKTIVISSNEPLQTVRLKHRNGLSESEASRRIASQWPMELKAAYADIVIPNDESIEKLQERVDDIWHLL